MKIIFLVKKARSALGGLLCLALFQLATPATCQAIYTSPYTFTTLAGKANPAWSFNPKGIAVDAAGNVYFADMHRQVICRVTSSGTVTILAGKSGCKGDADGVGSQARFHCPHGVALDAAGNIYVADSGNNTVRRITPAGVVTTLAGFAGAADYVDGRGSNARFNYPGSLAIDRAGNVYVADVYNSVIRKVTSDGVVTTLAGIPGLVGARDGRGVAARFNVPLGIAVDNSGNVYVADVLNNAIREVAPDGTVTTLAGTMSYAVGNADGAGSIAQFCHPCGVAVDSQNNIYVADAGNQTIRRITPSRVVTTVAGFAGQSGSANGTGSSARFFDPLSLALDRLGNLYVADSGNAAIRKGFASTNTAFALNSK